MIMRINLLVMIVRVDDGVYCYDTEVLVVVTTVMAIVVATDDGSC